MVTHPVIIVNCKDNPQFEMLKEWHGDPNGDHCQHWKDNDTGDVFHVHISMQPEKEIVKEHNHAH